MDATAYMIFVIYSLWHFFQGSVRIEPEIVVLNIILHKKQTGSI